MAVEYNWRVILSDVPDATIATEEIPFLSGDIMQNGAHLHTILGIANIKAKPHTRPRVFSEPITRSEPMRVSQTIRTRIPDTFQNIYLNTSK